MARPEFKRISDLRGKRIGVTRVGSSTHTVTLYVLNQAGLKPGDYEVVPLGEVPNILIALAAGRIDAGPLSSPTTIRGRKAGLVDLATPAKDGPEYVSIAIGATRAYIRANPEIVRRFMRAYAEAVHIFKSNKPIALKTLQKYTRVTDQEILEETHKEISRVDRIDPLPKPPRYRNDPRRVGRRRSQIAPSQAGRFCRPTIGRGAGERWVF